MQIQKAFKFRLYPDSEQQADLTKQFGHTRFVYNRYLDIRTNAYFAFGESLNYVDCANAMAELKTTEAYAWLKEADSQALQQSLKNLDKAFENYFRMCREGTLPPAGKKPRKDGMPKGYPAFHSKHYDQSIRYPQRVKVEGSEVYLPKVGWVKGIIHRNLVGTINSATVSKTKTGKYFVSLQCECEIADPRPAGTRPLGPKSSEEDFDEPDALRTRVVGIDLGLKDFITLSNGGKVEAPKFYRNTERILKIRGRRLSRKMEARKQNKLWINRDKGDNSIKDASQRLAATHEKIANRRLDFHHQLSRQLVDNFDYIAFEDLNIKGMMANHNLAKSISDAGWSQFVTFVTYKAAWSGVTVEHVDRFFPSSKLCYNCGHKHTALKLNHREWTCTNCGTRHDRDMNAANNILSNALSKATATQGAWESHAVGLMSQPVGNSAPEQVQEQEGVSYLLFEAHRL